MAHQAKFRWYQTYEYVDEETGELITKSAFERGNYRKLYYEDSEEYFGTHGVKHRRWIIRPHEQQQLWG